MRPFDRKPRSRLAPCALTAPLSLVATFLLAHSLPAQPQLVIKEGHHHGISAAAFRPDGTLLATGGYDGTVKLWKPDTGQLVRTVPAHGYAVGIGFSAGGQTLVAGGINSSALIVDLGRGTVLHSGRLFQQGGYCGGAVSGDGRLFAGGGDRNVGIYRLPAQSLVHHFEAPQQDRFYDLAFSPTSSHLAVASDESTVYVLALPGGKEVRRLGNHGGHVVRVLFHPDDKHLVACVRDGAVTVWDWRAGKVVRRIGGGEGRKSTSLALGPGVSKVSELFSSAASTSIAEDELPLQLPYPGSCMANALILPARNPGLSNARGPFSWCANNSLTEERLPTERPAVQDRA